MKKYKEEKGSMAVYVIVTLVSFCLILTGIYISTSSVRKAQIKTDIKIKEVYETGFSNISTEKEWYIEDNLDALYDGIYNESDNTHSNSLTQWKDLSGNNRNITSVSGTVGENYIQLQVGQSMQIPLSGNYNVLTVELTVSDLQTINSTAFNAYGAYTRLMSIHLPWSDNNIYLDTSQDSSGYERIYKTIDFDKTAKHTITCVKSTLTGQAMYIDGNLWVQNANLKRAVGNITGAILGGGTSDLAGTGWTAKVYSLRIYSKGLTQDEITKNYNLDKIRFEM